MPAKPDRSGGASPCGMRVPSANNTSGRPPASAAFAVKRFLTLDAVVPCHYGSFPIIEPNADKFVAAMAGHKTKVIVPDKGKAFTV